MNFETSLVRQYTGSAKNFFFFLENALKKMENNSQSVRFLSTLSIVCSSISPMASRILSFEGVNFLGLIGVTFIFDGTPQIIVQRCQISAPKWPSDISSAADNAIYKNKAQKSSVASTVWHVEPSC